MRTAVVGHLRYLGLVMDPEANAACVRGVGGVITHRAHPARGGDPEAPLAMVVPTDEELVIARDAAALT